MSDHDSDEVDKYSDKELDRRARKNRVSVPGAIVSGVFGGLFMALTLAIPGLGLPFVTPVFNSVMAPLLIGSGASIVSTFMQMGYSTHRIRKAAKFVENGAGAFALYSLWAHYPFNFAAIGVNFGLDKWLPIVFGAMAIFSGIAAIINLGSAIRGPMTREKKRLSKFRKDEEDLDD